LREINTRSKNHVNGINVCLEPVRGNLKLSCRGFVQFFCECLSVAGRAAAKVPSQNKLAVSLDSDKAVGIPQGRVIVSFD
jgi:hypothetical protein